MIFSLFRKNTPAPSVERVYADIVAASRAAPLYASAGIPDTVMGRFESLVLHMSLVLRRLGQLPPPADSLAQELVDRFFADLDQALREIGVGDVSVPKKVKKLGQAFYGRLSAYDSALAEGAGAQDLESALARNVLEKPDQPGLAAVLAAHVRSANRELENASFEDLLDGRTFSSPAGQA